MKLLHPRNLDDFETGHVKLLPHDNDDMWNIYNLINKGDLVTAKTNFKFQTVASVTGAVSTVRRTLNKISITAEKLDWDGTNGIIRVSGPLVGEVENLHKGQYLTLQLEKNEAVSIEKEVWDSVSMSVLRDSTNIYSDTDTVAVVMHHGLAHICYVTRSMCPTVARIELSIPKKRAGPSGHDKAVENFYNQIAQALLQHVHQNIKCCVLASPGFVAGDFLKYLTLKYQDKLGHIISKSHIVHASSGHKHSLLQALQDPSLSSLITKSSLVYEQEYYNEFLRLLDKDPDRAYYGYEHCYKAAFDHHAVQTLLVIDTLFKSENEHERRKYIELVDQVKNDGGNVVIYSSQNPTGEQLKLVTGVVAILYYGIENIDEEEEADRYMHTYTTVRDRIVEGDVTKGNTTTGHPSAAASSSSTAQNPQANDADTTATITDSLEALNLDPTTSTTSTKSKKDGKGDKSDKSSKKSSKKKSNNKSKTLTREEQDAADFI